MVETIVPMVHGKRGGFRLVAAMHMAGAAVGGSVAGALAGTVGAAFARLRLPGAWAGVALSVAAALAALREVWFARSWLPGRRGQVPRAWSEQLDPPATSLLYGIGIGLGFATHVASAAYWVAFGAAMASASPMAGAALGAVWGLARALTTVLLTRGAHEFDGARIDVVDRTEPVMRLAVGALLAVFSGTLVA